MPLEALPDELLEQILVWLSADEPSAIAAFAQACHAHRSLVYHSKDHHLWREIFLAIFDDPRNVHDDRKPHTGEEYDWGAEYRRRVAAARYVRHSTDSLSTPPPAIPGPVPGHERDADDIARQSALLCTLLSVVDTAAPCPPTIVFSFLSSPDPTTAHAEAASPPGGRFSTPFAMLQNTYPIFPPVPTALGKSASASPSGKTFCGKLKHARNLVWLRRVIERGLPPETTALLAGKRWHGGTAGQYLELAEQEEMQALGRLVSCIGFRATPYADEPGSGGAEHGAFMFGEKPAEMAPGQQNARARRLARMRVYNMRYLVRERHFGPFLSPPAPPQPMTRPAQGPPPQGMPDDELLQPIFALFADAHAREDEEAAGQADMSDTDDNENEEEEEDDDGEDDIAETDEEETPASTDRPRYASKGTNTGDETEVEDELAEQMDRLFAAPPKGQEYLRDLSALGWSRHWVSKLRPDWSYIAAARVVLESNLREKYTEDSLAALLCLEGLRTGSAPRDCESFKLLPTSEADKDKGKGRDTMTVSGSDWAGVTGIWK